MNDENTNQEKDFRGLIARMVNFGEIRIKMICQIDDILDSIKQNRLPAIETKKEASVMVKESEDVISQLRAISHKIDLDNERLSLIIKRLNELV